jgi:hypothetical protein
MSKLLGNKRFWLPVCLAAAALAAGCDQAQRTNTNLSNSSSNLSTANSANYNSNTSAGTSMVDAREPESYQATVTLTFEATGDKQTASLPPLGANVARNGEDRVMEFNVLNNEKVIYLDKGGKSYLILPNRKQYAELTKESLGFEVRSVMMPENIVQQLKTVEGVQRAGEETVNGRQAIKYTYSATANTQTQAGNVDTNSYFLVDKETGLPLRSETVARTESGSNIQGYKGARIVTEMSDIKTSPDPKLFELPTDYAKIDPDQVKAQINVIFQAASAIIGQMVKQAQQPSPGMSPTPSPTPTM